MWNRGGCRGEPVCMRVIETPTAGPWCWTCRQDLSGLPDAGCCPRCGGRYNVAIGRVLRHGFWARTLFGRDRAGMVASRGERAAMIGRVWVVLITVLGSSGIVITFGVLGLRAAFPGMFG